MEPRVLLACSGLDHARRGFESFARECFEALSGRPGIQLELVKGSGISAGRERALPSLRRDHRLARALARGRGVPPFRIEHFAFGLSLAPLIAARRPDVVYLSEWDTARVLSRWRQVNRQSFKLLLSNGTFVAEGFEHLDRVQELTPAGYDYVVARGADPRRHTVLPLGFRISPELPPLAAERRAALRRHADLPTERPVLICVAALNRSHKRLDYLIEEVASLPAPRPFLLLVGARDDETPALEELARRRLGAGGYAMRSVAAEAVPDLLRASDIFVLASVVEAQGRALVEAMSHGLPCLAHDSPITRFALGEEGSYGNFLERGSLTSLLVRELAADPGELRSRALRGHSYVYERFSWDRLAARYVELLRDVALGAANNTVSSSTGE